MSYTALARRFRPRHFGEVVGQSHVTRALANGLRQSRLHHAYLFSGTRGVGKTTLGRILAKCLNCEQGVTDRPCGECDACRQIEQGRFIDLLEVDAASRTRVDDTRALLDNVQYAPTAGRYKVYLIDEVHMLSTHSFNALLKTLEEPPPHVKFVLATTEPQKLPATVLSRCLQFHLRRLPEAQIQAQLEEILTAESRSGEPEALRLLAQAADGSMRDALSLLDQALSWDDQPLAVEPVRQMLGVADAAQIDALLQAIVTGDGAVLGEQLRRLHAAAPDYESVLDALLEVLQQIALAQLLPADSEQPLVPARAELAAQIAPPEVQVLYQIGLLGKRDLQLAPAPAGGFEMTVLRMFALRPDAPGTTAVARPPAGDQTGPGTPTTTVGARRSAGGQASPGTSASSAGPAPVAGSGASPRGPAAPQLAVEGPAKPPPESSTDEAWEQLVQRLPLKGMAAQLARNAMPIARASDAVTLALPRAHQAVDTPRARERVEAALRAAWEAPALKLRVELVEAVDGQTPAARAAEQTAARAQLAAAAVAADPTVRELEQRLQARVDDIRIDDDEGGQ